MESDGDKATAVGCPSETSLAGKASVCQGCPGQYLCSQQGGVDPDQEMIDLRMNAVKHKIIVLSGKGGVGKSSLAATLSIALANMGNKVGLVDLDICGPSVPKLMAVEGKQVINSPYGWTPLKSPHFDVKVMSVGSLLQKTDNAIIWRGPRKTGLIKQFLKDTFWGRLDFLIFDTPPGTSDEHLTVVKALKNVNPNGAVLVTTPQDVALATIRKELNFCRKMDVKVLGIVENMSGFVCPYCQECSDLFSSGGADELARENGLRFLGKIPVDQKFNMATASTATVQDLGNLQDLSKKEKTFFVNGLKDRKLFPALPEPNRHDWLSSHSETKQSHNSWWQRLQTAIPPSRKDKKKICLVPLGDEWTQSEIEKDKNGNKESFLSLLQHFAAVFFTGFQVDVLPSVSIAKLKCKTRVNCGTPQLYIPDVYKYLQAKWPPGAFCVVGITMIDLYPKETWNFVFGQANSSIGVGVFSFARYDPLFYEDDPEKRVSLCTSILVLWRSCKVMVHEICHLFCLQHCVYFSCSMNGSNHLEESNNRPMFMCPVCLHKLKSWLGFDVKQRFQAMLEFCASIQDENFEGSCLWLEKAIEKLS